MNSPTIGAYGVLMSESVSPVLLWQVVAVNGDCLTLQSTDNRTVQTTASNFWSLIDSL